MGDSSFDIRDSHLHPIITECVYSAIFRQRNWAADWLTNFDYFLRYTIVHVKCDLA